MLSIAVNVKNGAQYLERTLSALSRFNDVVLLDNYSTDNTVAIARTFSNVRVFEHEFCGMGKVRNMAAGYAKYDWVLFVDCDEILNQQMVDSLLNTKFEDGYIYRILRYNYYDGFRVDTSSWGNDWILRLYNRKQTRFEENEVHDSFVDNGLKEKKLHGGYMYHFPYENVNKLIDKMQFYSTLYAKQHYGKKTTNLYLLPFRAFMMFFKCYVLKRGFMQGYEGLAISSYNAMGVFSKYIKLFELSYKRKIGLAINMQNHSDNLLPLINNINEQTLLPQKVFIVVNNLNPEVAQRLEQLLKHNLVVPAKVVDNASDVATTIKAQFVDEPELQNIIGIKNAEVLANHYFFKQCKTAVLKGKAILSTDIFYAPLKGI